MHRIVHWKLLAVNALAVAAIIEMGWQLNGRATQTSAVNSSSSSGNITGIQ